jgi:ketosteroid isomerase-like protein
MSIEHNVSLVRRYFEECVSAATGADQPRALAVLDDLLTHDFEMAYNNESGANVVRGRDEHKEFVARHARYFPEDEWIVDTIVADAARVACQWRFHGTHGETANTVEMRAADFFIVRDGRLAELRRFLDFKSFEEQLQPQD